MHTSNSIQSSSASEAVSLMLAHLGANRAHLQADVPFACHYCVQPGHELHMLAYAVPYQFSSGK